MNTSSNRLASIIRHRLKLKTENASKTVSKITRIDSSKSNTDNAYPLMLHGTEFRWDEIVLNPDIFTDIKPQDIVQVIQPGRNHPRLILQVVSMAPVKGKVQISILKDIASQFNLEPYQDVNIQKLEVDKDVLQFIELTFKDRFISRADIWRFKTEMCGKAVHTNKSLHLLGIRAQVKALSVANGTVQCGVVGSETKLILRSRSSRIFWLIQMSTEMWEFDDDGEIYYEKLLNRLIKVLFDKWHNTSAAHSVTIILFSRSFYDPDQFPSDFDPENEVFHEFSHQGFGPGRPSGSPHNYGPIIHVDVNGQYYEDFYQVVAQDFKSLEWGMLLRQLKLEITNYFKLHRWRMPGDMTPALYHYRTVSDVHGKMKQVVEWDRLPMGVPSRAVDGNLLEAINVTLNMVDKHYMDRDLNRSGQGIVCISAGSGVFKVEPRLSRITKQRMMDNGVGMDLISLSRPPLHAVPLFINREEKSFQSDTSDDVNGEESAVQRPGFHVPHWINISFLHVECNCEFREGLNGLQQCVCPPSKTFHPVPPFRMFDLAAPQECLQFPVALKNMLILDRQQHAPAHFQFQEHSISRLSISEDQPMLCDSSDEAIHLARLPNLPLVLRDITLEDKRTCYEEFQRYDSSVFKEYYYDAESNTRRSISHVSSAENLRGVPILAQRKPLSNSNSVSPHQKQNPLLRYQSESPMSSFQTRIPLSRSFENRKGRMMRPLRGFPTAKETHKRRTGSISSITSSLREDVGASPQTNNSPDIPASENSLPQSMECADNPSTSATLTPRRLSLRRKSKTWNFWNAQANVNPFQTLANDHSQRLSGNRRRWIHLFPPSDGTEKSMYSGLNWASLVSPACLPLTTDYYPHPNDLRATYTESFYTLTLPSESEQAAIGNHNELLIEMVCQRMAQDFQLVETRMGKMDTPTKPKLGASRDLSSHSIVYHLSMGHRIHQLIYNEELQTIEVKRYVRRFKSNSQEDNQPYSYRYSLYCPFTNAFHPACQHFLEFASPEYNWNYLDQFLCGYYDHIPESTKYRRIRYSLVPPIMGSVKEENEYYERFLKFIEALQGRVNSTESIQIRKYSQYSLEPSTEHSRKQRPSQYFKINLTKSGEHRQEWCMLHLDACHHTKSCFQLEVRWISCSGLAIDDFVSSLQRKSKQLHLDFQRVPEFARCTYLRLTPLLCPVFLQLPETICTESIMEQILYRLHFVFDEERITDRRGFGVGLGIEYQVGVAAVTPPYRKYRMTMEEMVKKRRLNGYRQYMHRTIPIFVRVIYNGVVWIPGYEYDKSGSSTSESTKELYAQLLEEVTKWTVVEGSVQDMVSNMDTSNEWSPI